MKEDKIILTLPMPPSVNGLYTGKGRRRKSEEYNNWIEWCDIALLDQKIYNISGDNWLYAEYSYYFFLYTKEGKKRVKDTGNFEKALTDFLCKRIPGLKDHKIKRIEQEKFDSDRNEVDIIIKEM